MRCGRSPTSRGVAFGSGGSVEYLSVEIRALPDGWLLTQAAYTQDLLQKWSMTERRAMSSLGDLGPNEAIDDESEPALADARMAQRMARGLNWLATRTRPGVACYVSQIAPAATRAPLRALALGKRCRRYLAGAKEHGLGLRCTRCLRWGRA